MPLIVVKSSDEPSPTLATKSSDATSGTKSLIHQPQEHSTAKPTLDGEPPLPGPVEEPSPAPATKPDSNSKASRQPGRQRLDDLAKRRRFFYLAAARTRLKSTSVDGA